MINDLVLRQVFSKLACSHDFPGMLVQIQILKSPYWLVDWDSPKEWPGNLHWISTPADSFGQTWLENGSEDKEAVKDSLDFFCHSLGWIRHMIWLSVPFTWPLTSAISNVTDDYGLLCLNSGAYVDVACDSVTTISSDLAVFLKQNDFFFFLHNFKLQGRQIYSKPKMSINPRSRIPQRDRNQSDMSAQPSQSWPSPLQAVLMQVVWWHRAVIKMLSL